jgi:signal transduction histidine kinase/DNA-binding response OmpR family regulator
MAMTNRTLSTQPMDTEPVTPQAFPPIESTPTRGHPQAEGVNASQARILIVDDDPEMIRLIKEVVELIPSEILVENDGRSALDLLHREIEKDRIDVILLDIRMPGEDGFHTLNRIKSTPRLQQIPVILITGLDSIEDKTRGLQMGADDYIIKPFDPQELLARLDVVLRIRRTEKMLRQRNRELAALDEINRAITSSLDLDEVLASALDGLNSLIQAEALAIILDDYESDDLVIQAGRATDGVRLEGQVIHEVDPSLQTAMHDHRSTLQASITSGLWNEMLDCSSLDLLCVPLLQEGQAIGAMLVASRPGLLNQQHTHLIEHIAATVVIAVDKARMFQDLEAFAEEIERSQNRLIQAEKMAAVGRLTASLAHEINNPLQAVQNSLHLAAHQGLSDGKRQNFLDMAQNEVNRLVQIVRRMLDFYRPSSATQSLNLNRPVEDALAIARKRIEQSHVQVEAKLASDLPPIQGTSNQLTQVFLNIVINAIEAMPDGGKLWVGTTYNRKQHQVIAAFRDSGPGIAPEIRQHLFEPFHTSKATGTGLGLAISYSIIERHSGTIAVENVPDGGTAFIVRLPEHREDT